MTVSPTAYESHVSAAVVSMLDACASWPHGRGQIAEDWGDAEALSVDGLEMDLNSTWAVVRSKGLIPQLIALQTYAYTGEVEVVLHSRADRADRPAEAVRRARNLAGDLAAELSAQLGTPGALVAAEIAVGETVVVDQADAANTDPDQPRELESTLTVRWRDLP